jgi:serine/threonine-protein kinase HipA
LILLEPGQIPPAEAHASDSIEWLDEDQLLVVLEKLPRRPLLAGESGLRLSLAGAQEKLPVIVREASVKDGPNHFEIGLPKNNIPSSHILKPEISGIDGSVYNEAFCLALARELRLDAASAKIGCAKDKTYLLVERYDRFLDDGQLRRLHQEDFCQALGVAP